MAPKSKGRAHIFQRRTLERISSIYIALLLSVFLLAFGSEGYAALTAFKYRLFLFISGGYVLAIVMLRTVLAAKGIQPVGKFTETLARTPMVLKLLFGFLFFSIASAVFSRYPGTVVGAFRREGLLTIGLYVLSCICLAKYAKPQRWMLYLLGMGVGLNSILGLIQLTGRNPLSLFPQGVNYYGAGIYYSGEFLGTIGNAGLLGAFLSLAVAVLAMAMIKCNFKGRFYLALPLFLAGLLIFTMGINAAQFALAVGFVLMLPIAITNRDTLVNTLIVAATIAAAFALSQMLIFQDGPILFARLRIVTVLAVCAAGILALLALWVSEVKFFATIPGKWYRISAAGIAVGVIISAVAYLWLHGSEHGGMIYEASQLLRGNWEDSFGTRRVYIWRNVLAFMRPQDLLLGTGPDTLGHWDMPPFTRYAEHLGVTLVAIHDAAHNIYLHILATGGLLSLLTYVGALTIAAANWIRFPDNTTSAIAGAGVLFYSIQAVFGITQFVSTLFFWACLGILLHAQCVQRKDMEE